MARRAPGSRSSGISSRAWSSKGANQGLRKWWRKTSRTKSRVALPPLPCARVMVLRVATWLSGKLELSPVAEVGSAGAFGGDHQGAKRRGGRTGRAEDFALSWFQHS